YKKEKQTAEVIDAENWFHTGDIGEWVEGRFLKITDRKKDLFKTSGGKYVAPQLVEGKMRESKYINQIMVVGSGRKYVSALIVPNMEQLNKWAKVNLSGQDWNNESLIAKPEIVKLIRQQLDRYNPFFSHPEQIKKFKLLANEWTVESGELTPSLKIKRKVIELNFEKVIEEMYASQFNI